MSWSAGWEEDYQEDVEHKCSTCGKRVYYIEWTNGGQDYIGSSAWASVDRDGEPNVYCRFFDDEQGWIEDHSHHVSDDSRKSRNIEPYYW